MQTYYSLFVYEITIRNSLASALAAATRTIREHVLFESWYISSLYDMYSLIKSKVLNNLLASVSQKFGFGLRCFL